ncbi:c-type cytochrome [Dyadobacter arcticus]|uniref:Heme-binding domain-containing protein n=1 Tax=Dyadobacter arcticus TaxID=1078754 RepID=A0ABX0UQB5_9BACT|nr:c-type cytochrome [Dyadobacter arcticus]NIJ54144.1 putative heme-binding domain-containing protein [Dyadobacter arcticus]
MYTKKQWLKLPMALAVLLAVSVFCGVMLSNRTAKHRPPGSKVDKIKLPEGFKAEHLYSPSEEKNGSWVSMTFDDKGRMITSDQYGGLFRLVLPAIGSTEKPTVETLKVEGDTAKVAMGYAHGLLYAFNSLYVMINNRENARFPKGSGLYRLQDTDKNDQYDKITLIKGMKGEGEHGPHSIILSPDQQSLYVVAGNFTDLPKMDSYRLMTNWKNDNLFPFIKDPRGHANDRHAPGGWIAHTDPDGKNWELVSAGYRNPYDIAFNEAGDLFAYDSDMEWDFGTPWYRPTRVCHATSGGDYGWRTGSANTSPAFADFLSPVMNIGQGSPTNLIYLKDARFPAKYKNTLLAFDWSFGIVHGLHLKPSGSTYTADHEEFLSGAPLPLTDGAIGPDGALYFLTGGRRLESDLYRVYYGDYKNIPAGANVVKPTLTTEHKQRTDLEKFHAKKDPKAVETSWPYLKSPDRFLRFAARLAIEHQPVAEWESKVYAEKDPQTLIYSSIALAREGDSTKVGGPILTGLTKIDYAKLDDLQKQALLRAVEVTLYRTGQPDAATKQALIAYLNPKYPSSNALQNRFLSKILITLEAPKVVEKTLALIQKNEKFDDKDNEMVTASADLILRNPQYGLDLAGLLEKMPPAQQMYYAIMLSSAKTGWTPQLSEQYFKWFHKAFSYQGGRSYIGFIDKARQMALKNVPKDKVEYYNKLSGSELLTGSGNDLVKLYSPKGPGRGWKVEDAVAQVQDSLANRDFDKGKMIFSAVLCNRCHMIQGEGSDVGPDLTQLGTRFSVKDMLESIIIPDKTVSDQFASVAYTLKTGESIVGRQINEDANTYFIAQNPFDSKTVRKIAKKEVSSTKMSTVSVMLPGLINGLNPNELRDLVAYLMSGGNKQNPIYTDGAKTQKGGK